ncbi:SRPBCC family protein [[Mycobacterium] nativiensis]|uniref:SRPBCC family protein n=1 Tax=[Mycobacterium] nativiensis TaxID=2855503 RepID=A0ABU5Y0A1_9MYCO|nr:SRPBCC family protein [Mycolicibacter sp. MYC340]MEB3033677.1 SRPBCC family protein [Mycolicibacter sp. MYC340]
MHPCEQVGLDFLERAPQGFSNSVDLAITPDEIWQVLADAEAWPHWASVITNVTWTSPEPHGVGTTRVVDMRGGIIGDEEFLAWEPARHMAFRFNASSTSALAVFVEDYIIEPTPQGCRLTWTLANRLTGPAAWFSPISGPLMNLAFRRFLSNLRRYTDQRFGASRSA